MRRSINSGSISVIDTTDSRKMDIVIGTNMPTIQMKNVNTNEFIPDYESDPMVLTATVYVDNVDISDNSQTHYVWYCKYGTNTEVQVGTARSVTINQNITNPVGVQTYRCAVTYQGLSGSESLLISRNESGANGSNGQPAPYVQAQYSVDNLNWHDVLYDDDKYIRWSYNGGTLWSDGIKIKGDDGTGITIKGQYNTVDDLQSEHPIGNIGDGYLVKTDLYIWVNETWTDVGPVRGPQGFNGLSSYTYIMYAMDENGADMSASPEGRPYIGVTVTNSQIRPETADSYDWRRYVGADAKEIRLSTSSTTFVKSNNIVTPQTITVTGRPMNTIITNWQYSIDGGKSFLTTRPNGVARNGNTIIIDGSKMTAKSICFRATDGEIEDTLTVSIINDGTNGNDGNDGNDGVTVMLSNQHLYLYADAHGMIPGSVIGVTAMATQGSNKITPSGITVSNLPQGVTAQIEPATNEVLITFTIAAGSKLGSDESTNGVINVNIDAPIPASLPIYWNKINDQRLVTDFVIETNDINGWKYTKWNSGKVEAWYSTGSLGTLPMTQFWTGIYSHNILNNAVVLFPQSLFNTAPTYTAASIQANGYMVAQIIKTTANDITYRAWSPSSSSETIENINIYCLGTWK